MSTEGVARLSPHSDNLGDIRGRLRLTRIESLRLYECSDDERVAEIALSLDSTRRLINPVVIDSARCLLIDGHHRVKAFEWLGLDHIPAFDVDYHSTDVSIRGWSRVTNAAMNDFERVLNLPGSPENEGPWSVSAFDPQHRALAHKRFPAPQEGADYLDHLTAALKSRGHSVAFRTEEEARESGSSYAQIEPVIGKEEVMTVVKQGRQFPYEVNRHLIKDRPLNLQIPLEAVGDHRLFERHVERQCALPVLSKGPGFSLEGRTYDEQIALFSGSEN